MHDRYFTRASASHVLFEANTVSPNQIHRKTLDTLTLTITTCKTRAICKLCTNSSIAVRKSKDAVMPFTPKQVQHSQNALHRSADIYSAKRSAAVFTLRTETTYCALTDFKRMHKGASGLKMTRLQCQDEQLENTATVGRGPCPAFQRSQPKLSGELSSHLLHVYCWQC
jgi:hypothetical protein